MKEILKEACEEVGISLKLGEAIYLAYCQFVREEMRKYVKSVRIPRLGELVIRENKYNKLKEKGVI